MNKKQYGNNYWHYGSDGVTPVVWTERNALKNLTAKPPRKGRLCYFAG